MVAKVGDDVFGSGTLQNFKEHGIDVDHVGVTKDAATGVATILVDQEGQNCIVIVPGANFLLSNEDLLTAEEIIAGAKVLICQLEIKPEVTLKALQLGKKHKVCTVLNAAPGVGGLGQEFFDATDILCVNESEAELIIGNSYTITDLQSAQEAVKRLQTKCCGMVVLTLGENGVMFCKSKDLPVTHISAEKVKAVDTTGAGDAFVGSMSYFLACHPDLGMEEVMRRSCSIASQSVLGRGTQTSFPFRKDLPSSLFE